jgi:zinc protease
VSSAIYAPQNLGKLEQALKEELTRALAEGFTADEIAQGQVPADPGAQRGTVAGQRLAASCSTTSSSAAPSPGTKSSKRK